MAAQQFTTAVYAKIVSLLEAHAGFTGAVRVGNIIDWTKGIAEARKYGKGNKPFADLAEFELEMGDAEDTLATLSTNYAARNHAIAAADYVWTEQFRQDYTIVIRSEERHLAGHETAVLEALTAIRKGLPRLGLAYVVMVGAAPVSRGVEAEATTNGERRFRVTRITVPVMMRFNHTELLT